MRHNKAFENNSGSRFNFSFSTFFNLGLALIFMVALSSKTSQAQPVRGPVQGPAAPAAPEPPPTFELDKKTNKRAHMDFNLNPKPISEMILKYSSFSNRKLLVFYFSAKCPHCQHAYPFVAKLSDELAAQGVASLALAIKFNTEDDIRGFIRDYKVHVPVFYDEDRTFGDNYGTGSIPLIVLVNEKGEYIRYKSFDENETPKMIKEAVMQFAKK